MPNAPICRNACQCMNYIYVHRKATHEDGKDAGHDGTRLELATSDEQATVEERESIRRLEVRGKKKSAREKSGLGIFFFVIPSTDVNYEKEQSEAEALSNSLLDAQFGSLSVRFIIQIDQPMFDAKSLGGADGAERFLGNGGGARDVLEFRLLEFGHKDVHHCACYYDARYDGC